MIMIDFKRMFDTNSHNLSLLYDAGILWKYFENLSRSRFDAYSIEARLYRSVGMNNFVDVFIWSDTPEGHDFWEWIEDHL